MPKSAAKSIFLKLLICAIIVLISWLIVSNDKKNAPTKQNIQKIPIIYSSEYNITFLGLQNLHPFDSEKYGKIYNCLINNSVINEKQIFTPKIANEEELLSVHSKEYLASLKKSSVIAKVVGMGELKLVPNFLLQKNLLNPMKYAVGGTILGGKLAMDYGWAINLAGGYHHAKKDSGGGFNFFSDIAIVIHKLWRKNESLKVMIVDLDAHQGNGYESIFKNDPRIFIMDIYNEDIYPNDKGAKKYIDDNLPIKSDITDSQYLLLLEKNLIKNLNKSNPDLIIYNAGTDIFEKDNLGKMAISKKGIIKRDEIVFKNAVEKDIPILMLSSGGYAKESADITAESITNIFINIITPKLYETNN